MMLNSAIAETVLVMSLTRPTVTEHKSFAVTCIDPTQAPSRMYSTTEIANYDGTPVSPSVSKSRSEWSTFTRE